MLKLKFKYTYLVRTLKALATCIFGAKICLLHKMTLFYLAFMIDNCTLSASEKSCLFLNNCFLKVSNFKMSFWCLQIFQRNIFQDFCPSLFNEVTSKKYGHFIKVSKSQKQFFLKLHCPKNERNI